MRSRVARKNFALTDSRLSVFLSRVAHGLSFKNAAENVAYRKRIDPDEGATKLFMMMLAAVGVHQQMSEVESEPPVCPCDFCVFLGQLLQPSGGGCTR